MIVIAIGFGAPESVPAGNVAATKSKALTSGSIFPITVETMCIT